MIQVQTYLNVADNTGAQKLMCIRILGSNKKSANIGEVIIAVVKEAIPNMTIKKSEVVKAVIVRSTKGLRRESGMSVRFDENAAVIIGPDGSPKGLEFLDQWRES
jgi:large subunit ribosomal protein L14